MSISVNMLAGHHTRTLNSTALLLPTFATNPSISKLDPKIPAIGTLDAFAIARYILTKYNVNVNLRMHEARVNHNGWPWVDVRSVTKIFTRKRIVIQLTEESQNP